MKSREEIKKWLLENCIDEYGDIDLSNLDFSDFKGNIYIGGMKVNSNSSQDLQQVKDAILQDCQKKSKDLYQDIKMCKKYKNIYIKAIEK